MTHRYDLHTHSLHSDGTTSPAAIVALAAELGLAGLSLTDHDTVAGWDEARSAAAAHGIDFLPGMEITTRYAQRTTHLLAYGFHAQSPGLVAELARLRDARRDRALAMVERLAADFDLDWDGMLRGCEDRTLGRPHLADALVAAGYYEDRGAAFADALHPSSPYYLPTYAVDTLHAIELVRDAGGVTVLAHPAAARMHQPIDTATLAACTEAGLWGIELSHPENLAEWLPPIREFAVAHNLHITGASDYHGAGKANRLGECTSSAETWQAIRELVAVKG